MSEITEIITIDGPAGVGKSTVSRRVAAERGYTYLDTGAMYRGVGLYLERLGTDYNQAELIKSHLNQLNLQLLPAPDEHSDVGVVLNGEDVSKIIRTPAMAMVASRVSAIPVVRKKLTEMQRLLGKNGKVVAEGRDMGSVVFPGARYKIFLDAEPKERARRRVVQLRERGEQPDEKEILAMIITRDKNDRERAIAPLKQAEGAVKIDTTRITIDEVVEQILKLFIHP